MRLAIDEPEDLVRPKADFLSSVKRSLNLPVGSTLDRRESEVKHAHVVIRTLSRGTQCGISPEESEHCS